MFFKLNEQSDTEPEGPVRVPRRLLPDSRARDVAHSLEQHQRRARSQPVPQSGLHRGAVQHHRVRSAVLRVLRQGSRRSARRWPARRAAVQRSQHRPDHRRIYSWYDGDSWRTGVNAKVSHFAEKFLGGSHDLKLGVQLRPGRQRLHYGEQRLHLHLRHDAGLRVHSTALPSRRRDEDAWFLPGRHVPAWASASCSTWGVRYDHSRALFSDQPVLDKNGSPTSTIVPGTSNLFTWDKLSPRIGLTYKVNASGRTVAKVHYGRYYRGIVTGEFDNASPTITPRYIFDGVYTSGGTPIGLSKVSRQLQPANRLGVRQPVYRPVHCGHRSGAVSGRGPAGELRPQTEPRFRRVARRRRHVRAGAVHRHARRRAVRQDVHA